MDETLGLVIGYMQQLQGTKRWVWDDEDEEGAIGEVLEGATTRIEFTMAI
jgi:hypothetical protein